MSLITLQVGQCGNQLGCSFYDFLYKEVRAYHLDWNINKKTHLGNKDSNCKSRSSGKHNRDFFYSKWEK